ncbi:Histidine phosphatase superfamily (branch 2), putative [Angomonas deanei]|uniref:Histidine phosphatase superfamily (Branch 2), putative n=1 Tax=Angomonas deanei TaxID=59799 RepID=A0A7G2C5F7_9TRYP|nr:Histidine phosphatase superfamily (branch 2), putative [Angomonas deanei]
MKVFVILLLLVAGHSAAAEDYTLEQVQLVHRHGSRSALVSYNDSLICGLEFPCGYLNRQGQDMLVNTGRFLRTRYTTDDTVVDPSSPFLTQESYNLTVSYTRSTDVLRTLQSADALLRGLFPNMTAYYPAVHTVMNKDDSLLNSATIPALNAKYHYGDPEERAACDSVVDHYFTPELLVRVASEVHYDGYCSNWTNRVKCVKTLCDIAQAYEPTGELQQHPLLNEHYFSLCATLVCSSRYLFSYDSTDALQREQGSGGQALAQELLLNVHKHLNQSSPFQVLEYSAHDTTLSPLAGTLGDNSDAAMMPPFGTTYVFELLRRATAAEGSTEVGDYAMRVKRGHPGVTPDTNFEFAWDDFELRCMHAAGDVYVAEGNVCPLEDFIRFIDSSKPTNAAGLCYIDPVLLARMNCSVTDTAFALSSDCLQYRLLCPSYACGKGQHVGFADKNCYKTRHDWRRQQRHHRHDHRDFHRCGRANCLHHAGGRSCPVLWWSTSVYKV